MSDDGHPQPLSPQQSKLISSGSQLNPQFPDARPVEEPNSRSQLLERARNFLYSPQVRYEDGAAKYKFLADKGLDDVEIRGLLQELPVQVPPVPPRTYPQPPPSNLPGLFIGLTRILSWITGGSLAILLVYFRYIYPRLTRSYQARHGLRTHQKELLSKLSTSITAVKTAQEETFSVLPRPDPYKEDIKFQDCHSLDSVFAASEKVEDISPMSLLRCAFEELGPKGQAVGTELLFETLEAKNAWIGSEEGIEYAGRIWDTLNTVPLFHREDADGKSVWAYTPPTSPPPPPLLTSLSSLQASLPPSQAGQSRFQHTLQTLSDFTGYIAAQTYAIPTTFRLGGSATSISPEAEEVRREIRALKGLALNRRSFMPSPKPQGVPDPVAIDA